MSVKRTIGIVACSKSKLTRAAPAQDIYQGLLFRLARKRVEATCDAWCILSAAHGVTMPEQVVAPYDQTLKMMSVQERREWAAEVHADLVKKFGANARYIVYAGLPYRAALVGLECEVPLEGLGIGQQIQKLQQMLREGGCSG